MKIEILVGILKAVKEQKGNVEVAIEYQGLNGDIKIPFISIVSLKRDNEKQEIVTLQ